MSWEDEWAVKSGLAAPIMGVMWKSPWVTRADMRGGDVVRGEVELEEVVDVLEEEHVDVSEHDALWDE